MFHLRRSNSLERLADALAEELRSPPLPSPFDAEWVAVGSAGTREFLERALANRLGVCAGVAMPFPAELLQRISAWTLGADVEAIAPPPEDALALAVLEELPPLIESPSFADVRAYVARDESGAALHGLAHKVAHAFSEYAVYRPEMIAAWDRAAAADDWQRTLYRAAMARLGDDGRRPAKSWSDTAQRTIEALRRGAQRSLPARISLFGIVAVPPIYLDVLAALGRRTEVHLYASTPSREFLGDAGRGALGNPLLSSLGRIARDFQVALEERTEYAEAGDLFAPPAAPETILGALQADVLRFAPRGEAPSAVACGAEVRIADGSLKILACRRRLRQVEAVRDELLTLFADESLSLRPEEVAVLAPAIAEFAPFIDAVFGGVPTSRGPSAVAIPHAILCGAGRSPLIDAAIALLAIADSRLAAKDVLDFLARPPVRRAFGLEGAALDALRAAVLAAGARFGLDAAHRSRLGLPATAGGTWRFALDRMLLGLALSSGDRASWRGCFPFDEGPAADPDFVARAVTCVEAVVGAAASLAQPRPLAAWCADLRHAVETVCDTAGEDGASLDSFGAALASIANAAAAAGSARSLPAAVFASELGARAGRSGAGRTGGRGVVCADLARMRGVPFRVVCVIGLDDAAFPRRATPPGFDRMTREPRPGDRSPRDEDNALFLEAICAAKERLVLAYSSDGGTKREARPSSVVGAILDAVGGATADRIVDRKPLEPFADAGVISPFDDVAIAAARAEATRSPANPGARRHAVGAPFPDEVSAGETIELRELVRFFRDPSAYFFERSVGVRIPREGEEPPEREPLELDNLSRHAVGNAALDAMLAGAGPDAAYERSSGAGSLPVGPFGRLDHDAIAELARDVAVSVRRLGDLASEGPRRTVAVDLRVEADGAPRAIVGAVDGVVPGGRIATDFGKRNGKRLIEAWIHHLALTCASGGERIRTFLCLRPEKPGGDGLVALRAVDAADELLAGLVAVFRRGLREPLPLFPGSSFAFAEASAWRPKRGKKTPEEITARAFKKAFDAWAPAFTGAAPGDVETPATHLLWGEEPPWSGAARADGGTSEFERLALEVYGPLVEHLDPGGGTP